jgi:AAHS family 4-hydroxybenzoate transporter-like MFS transporter
MAITINVADFIDEHKISSFQIKILILCSIVMFIDGFDSQSMGYCVPLIAKQWSVEKAAFGPVFSGGLLGMALGALGFGALADRFGRKSIVVFCVFYFSIFSFAKVFATDVPTLLVLHFLACLGLGGAMSSAIALIAEYSSIARRAMMIGIVGCVFSIGVAAAGVFAASVFPIYGWQSLFFVGSIVPFVLGPVMMVGLPESIRFLMLGKGPSQRVERILKKIEPSLERESQIHVISTEKKVQGLLAVQLLTAGRAPSTLLLWLAAFMDLVIIYFVTSWLPTMLQDAGLSISDAELGASAYVAAGIVGAPVVGRLMDRFGATRMLALAFGVACCALVLIGQFEAISSFPVLCLLLAFAGFFALGGHFGITALAGELYPTFMRSTGIGWALGVGRFCSLISPILGGILIARHWGHDAIFAAVAMPALIAAVAILMIHSVRLPESFAAARKLKARLGEAS